MASLSLTISGVLAILAGLAIILFPKLLRWALGAYLIIIGLLSLLG